MNDKHCVVVGPLYFRFQHLPILVHNYRDRSGPYCQGTESGLGLSPGLQFLDSMHILKPDSVVIFKGLGS